MRTFWLAFLDPAERPWAVSTFLTVWIVFAVAQILTGGSDSF